MAIVTWSALKKLRGAEEDFEPHLEERYIKIPVADSWSGISIAQFDGEFHIVAGQYLDPIGKPLTTMKQVVKACNALGADLGEI